MFGFGVGIQRLGSFGVDTLAALLALSPPATGLRPTGFVYADPDKTKNGVYIWTGSAWQRERGLPESIASLKNVAGTANAITAQFEAYIDPSLIVAAILVPVANNTGAVTLNGTPIKDAAGAVLTTGALRAGRSYLLHKLTSEYRTISLDNSIQRGSDLMAAIEEALPTLPTSLPSTAGKLWNNGGVLCIS